jgi:hypothetical protein
LLETFESLCMRLCNDENLVVSVNIIL